MIAYSNKQELMVISFISRMRKIGLSYEDITAKLDTISSQLQKTKTKVHGELAAGIITVLAKLPLQSSKDDFDFITAVDI